jgi:hypothetical protein
MERLNKDKHIRLFGHFFSDEEKGLLHGHWGTNVAKIYLFVTDDASK